MRSHTLRKTLTAISWGAPVTVAAGWYVYPHHQTAGVALFAATAALMLPSLLYLYHRWRGPQSLFWLVLPARCVRCGSREGLRRWHRGWHCEDVLPCFDRARAQSGIAVDPIAPDMTGKEG